MLWPLDDVLEFHKNLNPECAHLTNIDEDLYIRCAELDYEYYEEKRETEGVMRYPGYKHSQNTKRNATTEGYKDASGETSSL